MAHIFAKDRADTGQGSARYRWKMAYIPGRDRADAEKTCEKLCSEAGKPLPGIGTGAAFQTVYKKWQHGKNFFNLIKKEAEPFIHSLSLSRLPPSDLPHDKRRMVHAMTSMKFRLLFSRGNIGGFLKGRTRAESSILLMM